MQYGTPMLFLGALVCLLSTVLILKTPNKGGVLHTATRITQPGYGSVVAEAHKLTLHGLGQLRALDVRVLRKLRGKLRVEVGRVESINL